MLSTRLIIYPLLVVALTLIAVSWHFSSILLFPSAYACPQDHYIYCGDPSELGLSFEDVTIKTEDGLSLSGWYIPGKSTTSGIVMVHGRNASRHEALRDVPSLHAQGHNLLLIDLRHSGKSERSFISMGFHERLDVHAAVDYLLQSKAISNVGVVGYSMGAATTIMAMAENSNIKAGWFDSAFADFDTIIRERFVHDYGFGIPNGLMELVRFTYEARGSLNSQYPSPIAVIAGIAPRPIMIVHGTADIVVPFHHGEELYAAAKEPKQMWVIPDGRHTRAWQADKEKSHRLITEFFAPFL